MSNEPKRTATPWEIGASKQSVVYANKQESKVIAVLRSNDYLTNPKFKEGEPEANAARIVQCVNACEGMDDPEKYHRQMKELGVRKLWNELESLRAERDGLVEALRSITKIQAGRMTIGKAYQIAVNIAHKTLAKYETK